VTAQPFLASLLSSPLRLPKLQRPAFLSASLAVTVSGSAELIEADWAEPGARGGCPSISQGDRSEKGEQAEVPPSYATDDKQDGQTHTE